MRAKEATDKLPTHDRYDVIALGGSYAGLMGRVAACTTEIATVNCFGQSPRSVPGATQESLGFLTPHRVERGIPRTNAH
jgi:hypothetical protein